MWSIFIFFPFAFSKDLPKWPKRYTLKGSWRIPYQRISEPFYVITDYVQNRQVESAYEGLQHTIHILNNRSYQFQPNMDHMTCLFTEISGPNDYLREYLPLKNEEWEYIGETVVLGKLCNMWEKKTKPALGWYYRFYADVVTNEPVRYFMHGQSLRHSHPADYYFDITSFGVTFDESAFYLPTNCKNVDSAGPVYAEDISKPKIKNIDFKPVTCPVEVPVYEGELPTEFTWRNVQNILSMPRDQANCGSCWAEAAASSVSAQFSLLRNQTTQVSVQQIVDCTWGPYNHACQGGESDDGLRYLVDAKRQIALEEEYPYLGVAGYCSPTVSKPIGTVTGCWQVPPKDNLALKKALFKHGPVIVAILGSLDTFVQYQKGVYKDAKCNSNVSGDHCVLLTGWKVIDGTPVWEIQNSWSDVWGDNGYAYISAESFDYDCGITLAAFLPRVELI